MICFFAYRRQINVLQAPVPIHGGYTSKCSISKKYLKLEKPFYLFTFYVPIGTGLIAFYSDVHKFSCIPSTIPKTTHNFPFSSMFEIWLTRAFVVVPVSPRMRGMMSFEKVPMVQQVIRLSRKSTSGAHGMSLQSKPTFLLRQGLSTIC